MRALRITGYDPACREILTMAVAEENLDGGIEGAMADEPGSVGHVIFTVYDVFEAPDDADVAQLGMIALARKQERAEEEQHMAMLYHWNGAHLALLAAGGVLSGTEPTPLSVEDITYVLRRLAGHPNYRPGTTVITIAEDERVVQMVDGEIEVIRLGAKIGGQG